MDVRLTEGTAEALAAFRAALPELLRTDYMRWVAVDRGGVFGKGDTHDDLYARCLGLGRREEDFIVRMVLPDAFEG